MFQNEEYSAPFQKLYDRAQNLVYKTNGAYFELKSVGVLKGLRFKKSVLKLWTALYIYIYNFSPYEKRFVHFNTL